MAAGKPGSIWGSWESEGRVMNEKILITKGHAASVRVQLREGYAASAPKEVTPAPAMPTTARAVSALRRPPQAPNR